MPNDGTMVTYPNFFLVGAMKAGTTTLTDAFASHADIHVCPIKEPNHFCTDLYDHGLGAGAVSSARSLELVAGGKRIHHAYIRDEQTYRSLFAEGTGQAVVADMSTNYLYSGEAARNIRAVCPDARIMIILRDPVERAFSEFVMNCSIGVAKPPFEAWLDREQEIVAKNGVPVEHRYVSAGLYHDQVKRYFDAFPRQQVKVILFDDLKSDFHGTMQSIADFLGIRPFSGEPIVSNAANYPKSVLFNRLAELTGAKRIVREWMPDALKGALKARYYESKPETIRMSDCERARLRGYFSRDIAELSQLIQRDLSIWNVH